MTQQFVRPLPRRPAAAWTDRRLPSELALLAALVAALVFTLGIVFGFVAG